jgi:hypothetical protein
MRLALDCLYHWELDPRMPASHASGASPASPRGKPHRRRSGVSRRPVVAHTRPQTKNLQFVQPNAPHAFALCSPGCATVGGHAENPEIPGDPRPCVDLPQSAA